MKGHSVWCWIAFIILIIGGLNWGLIGFFHFDLIAAIFGDMSMLTRAIYAVVGLAALYAIYGAFRDHPKGEGGDE